MTHVKEYVRLAELKINEAAARVLGCILTENTRNFDPNGRPFSLQLILLGLTLNKISTLLDPSVQLEVEGPSRGRLRDYLDTLAQDEAHFLSKRDEKGGGQYMVDTTQASQYLKQRILESIIQEKWGRVGCRIWRLLHLKNKLDEKQVSKLAMIAPKAGRECLYKMLQEGFVFLQVCFFFTLIRQGCSQDG